MVVFKMSTLGYTFILLKPFQKKTKLSTRLKPTQIKMNKKLTTLDA